MARRGSAIAGNRAVGTAPSTGGAMAPATPASPLAQSLATGMGVSPSGKVNPTGGWGDAYGGIALPRNPMDFTNGAFGPFSPIVPSPIDAPPDGSDFPLARREQYRVGWNLPTGQPGAEGLKLADFGTLQTLADLYSVARACIQFLKSQIAALEWDVAPTTEAAKSMRNSKGQMQDFGERRGEAVKFFRRPDPDYFNWQSWMSAVMEEVLVFDALSIVLRPKWGKGLKKGVLWSDLDSLNLVSGPTIRPLYDLNGATPRPPSPAYQQYLYGVPRVDLMTMIRQHDLDDGRLTETALGAYTNSQLLYLPTVPRRWTPYGFPPIERALIPVLTGLSKQGYQLDYFKEGTVPSVYISPGGDLSPNQIRELQDALNAIAGDPAWHHKIIVLPSGSHTEPQRPTPLADTFDEIVMTQVCSAFGVQPMQIGISPRATAMTSPGAQNQMAKAASGTQDMATLQPMLLFLTGIMNTILQDVCAQHDMRFVFAGMQEEEDEETTTNLLVNQVSHALITIDEARDKLGLQPYGITESTEPGFLTATGFVFLSQPAAPLLPGGDQGDGGDGNDGATGGGGSTPPGGKPAAPPQYGPKPNGPANSTQGKPAQPPAREPGEKSPGNSAADGADSTQGKPDKGGVNKAAAPDQQPQDAQPEPEDVQIAQAAVEAYIAAKVAQITLSAWQGAATLLGAVDMIVAELAGAYLKVMKSASVAAAKAVTGVTEMAADALFGFAQQRAETQRAYSMGMVQAAINDATMGGVTPPAWIPTRSKLYAETLAGAGNAAYGKTVETSQPQYKLVWRLGETEHCPLCIGRDGQEFTFDTLPGYPGDGGFGGPICLGGPNCGCHVDYMEGDHIVDAIGNTQRPESVGYYAQQNSDIQARRQQMQVERDQFVADLPNVVGPDSTSTQTRAQTRDDMRRQLAEMANQRIRSTGGYPGVSVEPADIPASLIASLIPQYGPIPANVPITDIMAAVESMFAGKFASADTTKAAFGSMILAVVGDTVGGWERAVVSELEACARHLAKGRAAGDWTPRKIDQRDVDTLADLLQTGAVTRPEAVKAALDNRRRWVDVGGQVMEPPTEDSDPTADETPPYQGAGGPVANAMRTNPAGGGGYTLLPHDEHGIYHDVYSLSNKAAADPGDPNPVEAEHVHNQMLANYPPKSIAWIKKARWIGPMAVDPERVDTQDEDSWAATKEPERVKHFAKAYKKDPDGVKPGVCVQEPGQGTVKIIDGHHRFLGARKAGEPYKAYVGFVDKDSGPWDETHSSQFHRGSDPKNKAATMSKATAHYRDPSDLTGKTCGNCSMYGLRPPDFESGACDLVQGIIEADAVCDHWDAKADKTVTVDIHASQIMSDADIQRLAESLGSALAKSVETAALSTVHRPLGTHGLWGDKTAQLPAYIQNVAHAMIRNGHDESEAVQMAVGIMRHWAAGGGKTTPEVQAAATAALAEWEKLKAEHSKSKAATPDLLKVGPHGYIHGWIFVGVPGMGDAVRHPSHGQGEITGHTEGHVTVRFQSGKTHTFQVHRDASEDGHFTERGKFEHEGPDKPVEPEAPKLEPHERVLADPTEVEKLTDDELAEARSELVHEVNRHGADWNSPIYAEQEKALSAISREQMDRKDAKRRAEDLHSSDYGDSMAHASRDEDLRRVKRDTERRAAEQGVDPDMIEGHRAARVELARRALKDQSQWNAHDHLPIFGGTPEQQTIVDKHMSRLASDVPTAKSAELKRIMITDENMEGGAWGLYYHGDKHMELHPVLFTEASDKIDANARTSGWFVSSKYESAVAATMDHEFGHHLDHELSAKERHDMYGHLSEVIGDKDDYTRTSDHPTEVKQKYYAAMFAKSNKASIVNDIGTYAGTNHHELVAELWAQYHAAKLNGAVEGTDEYAKAAADIVGHHFAQHSTETTRSMGVEYGTSNS